jgi:hypothetical protein
MPPKNKEIILISPRLGRCHPLIGEECLICHQFFVAGQRIIFAPPIGPQSDGEDIPSVPIHAGCALLGAKTPVGEIARLVDDGDTAVFIITTDGHRHTLREAGFAERPVAVPHNNARPK